MRVPMSTLLLVHPNNILMSSVPMSMIMRMCVSVVVRVSVSVVVSVSVSVVVSVCVSVVLLFL